MIMMNPRDWGYKALVDRCNWKSCERGLEGTWGQTEFQVFRDAPQAAREQKTGQTLHFPGREAQENQCQTGILRTAMRFDGDSSLPLPWGRGRFLRGVRSEPMSSATI